MTFVKFTDVFSSRTKEMKGIEEQNLHYAI